MRHGWKKVSYLLVAIFATASTSVWAAEEAVSLFNGKDLEGWTQRGGKATYAVEGDEIVGTSVPDTGNSFLCTNKNYENFVLDLDFKVDALLNSGIQIRSNQFEEAKTWTGTGPDGKPVTAKVPAGRVHGYQVEIDPSARAWSGGIYDEGRRGWLYNLTGEKNAAARAAFKPDEWNHYRIVAQGNKIQTWVNGVPAADLTDDMTTSGFIALQVHGIGKDANKVGKQIRWKNIKLQVLPATAAAAHDDLQLDFPGKSGPGQGKKIVLVSGDEEYRSEQALTQLAKILSQRHGFDCTVLFAIDPQTGAINPNLNSNIPGLQALDSADLLILFTRFRNLPDDQMEHFDAYLRNGKPVLGIRTATHAFNIPGKAKFARYGNGYKGELKEWEDGFGRLVLGEHWVNHHGSHRHQSTSGVIAPGAKDHPIVRGIQDGDIWGSTDVYGVRLPLPGDSRPLVLGKVMNRAGEYDADDVHFGMRQTDSEPDQKKNDPMMPIVWLKSYQLPDGKPGTAMTSTIGSSADLLIAGVRRELVNGAYFLLGLGEKIPAEGTNVDLVGEYQPDAYGGKSSDVWKEKNLKPSDFK